MGHLEKQRSKGLLISLKFCNQKNNVYHRLVNLAPNEETKNLQTA